VALEIIITLSYKFPFIVHTCYVADWATLRSVVWSIGYGCTIALFVLAMQAS
jgi:uncharacterized MAPEG superfamily protein